MEPSEETVQINKENFLEVPSLSDSLTEDEEIKETFNLRFSPLPRRRSSDTFESDYPYVDTPSSGSRRVSFADAFGFNLVSVKEFDNWELPGVSTHFDLRDDVFHTEEYILSPLFDLPSSREVLMQELQVQKAILESTEFLTGPATMKGTIRVLNVSFEKVVYVRMSLDNWQTHYDILAEYVPNSCDGETDQFSFKISLVPPYQKDGARIEFCIRYETSIGTFWSNNNGGNYTLVCQKKEREQKPEKSREVITNRQLKGCLKVKSSKEESEILENNCNNSRTTDTSLPTIIFSHEDKEDMEANSQNVKDVNKEYDEHSKKELELMLNQYSVRTRSPSTRDESSFTTESVNFSNTSEEFENQQTLGEISRDLLRRPLSPSSSTENPLKGELYSNPKYSLRNEVSHQLAEDLPSGLAKSSKPSLTYTDSGETAPSLGSLLIRQQDEHSSFLDESESQGIKWVDNSKSKSEGTMGSEMVERPFTSQGKAHTYKKSHEMTVETVSSQDDKVVPLGPRGMEVLDDNANPAEEGHKLQTSSPTAYLPLAGNADQGKGERTKMIEAKDWECPTRESLAYIPARMNASKECPVTEKRASRKGRRNIKEKEEQRIKFGISERQNENVLSTSTDHQERRGHPETGVNMSQASNNSFHDSQSKVNEICASSCDLPPRAARSNSLRTDLASPKDGFTAQRSELVNSEDTTPERMHGQVCSSENGNVLQTDQYLPRVQREKSDRNISDDRNKIACGNPSWNILESQVVLREGKTNRTEQIKEQADGEDKWEIRDNTRNLNVTPTEELFTCQETVRCELSSVADHGITEKAEAGTAYIIKTTSESTLESMSAREKAIIAKLPQETSLSDRPTEERETAFDPHEGRNDDSHYTLCHRDSVDVIYDIDFEKKSHLGIYNVHIDETRKEETMSQCNSGEILDRAEHGIRNIAIAGESRQVTSENGKASSELDFYSVQLATVPKILKKNIYHAEAQSLPQKNADLVALAHQSFNSERNICPQNGTSVSICPNKTQYNEEAFSTDYPVTAMSIKSVSTTSEFKHDPYSEVQYIKKNQYPGPVPQEYSKSSGILTSTDGRERFLDESSQQAENNMEKSLGPMILISEPVEEIEETSCETAELINYGQELASPGFKPGNRSDSSNLPVQDNQTLATESKYSSKISYFLLFILFLLTTYYFDLMISLVFYLFSLYWLSWEGGRPQEPVKKK
ncbi:protein phosphatase 1 regulatory subunit 3A [Sarcophilus harrisii]|uniref:protein phosphatase 1 regulatory subunit 3A n=1 Tax=Sarcophilus harrisii TaxID=9305 RepID=UPI00062B8BD4|nr:protein phosphatase 1 regulatory subunit 3A [Sarcophilus harrisii]